jgi:predicted GNAT family N-acyltransferase
MDITFKFANNKEDAFEVRRQVFINEQGFKDEYDVIDEDPRMIHLTLYCDGVLAGCARLFPSSLEPKIEGAQDLWILGRFAILPEYRSYGLGTKILQASEAEALRQGAQRTALHAQCRVRPFYEKSGYVAYGPIELEEHVEHQWMEKNLTK